MSDVTPPPIGGRKMLEAVLGSPSRGRRDDGVELMDVGSGLTAEGIAPLRVSSSTEDLAARLGQSLVGPGPCLGKYILKMAPSHEKTASQRTLKDNCLYFMCIPIWARTGAAFSVGLTFLLLGFFVSQVATVINQNAVIRPYYSLDEQTNGGFATWRQSYADPRLGPSELHPDTDLSPCASVRVRCRDRRLRRTSPAPSCPP